jgi:hypothetical protein
VGPFGCTFTKSELYDTVATNAWSCPGTAEWAIEPVDVFRYDRTIDAPPADPTCLVIKEGAGQPSLLQD